MGPLTTLPFTDTNWLTSHGKAPLSYTNILNVPGGSGNTLCLDTNVPAWLVYNVVETNGITNLNVATAGSFSLWFNPSWSDTNHGGAGPQEWGRFFETGVYTTNASIGWLSFYLSPDGTAVYFSGQDNSGHTSNYLAASSLTFASNTWCNLVLTYGPSNSALFINGQHVTNGSGVAYYPSPTILSNGFSVGSSAVDGFSQTHGLHDDFTTYNYQLDAFAVIGNFSVNAIAYDVNLNLFTTSGPYVPATNASGVGFNAVTGYGFLQHVGASGSCITNSRAYLTNAATHIETDKSITFSFDIAGGTNNVPYDIFGAAPLLGHSVTNMQWFWLGQGLTCNRYSLTNQPKGQAFYMLGGPTDTDQDGLTDAFEILVSKTDPNNPDTNGNGILDGWEVTWGLNPLVDAAATNTMRLNFTYDPVGRLGLVTGIRAEGLTNDFEGNITLAH